MPTYDPLVLNLGFEELEARWSPQEQRLLGFGFQEAFLDIEPERSANRQEEAEAMIESLLDMYLNWSVRHSYYFPSEKPGRLPFALVALFGPSPQHTELGTHLRLTPGPAGPEGHAIDLIVLTWTPWEGSRLVDFDLRIDDSTTRWRCRWGRFSGFADDDAIRGYHLLLDCGAI